MLLEIALGDALGIAFEFVKDPAAHGLRNDLTFQQNPRYGDLKPSQYTDDTLRSLATAAVIISARTGSEVSSLFDPAVYAASIQASYDYDKRPGWSRNFQSYLEQSQSKTPEQFMSGITKRAETNGSIMGCLPISFIDDIVSLKLAASAQALSTHSAATIPYAQALTLAGYYLRTDGSDREQIIAFVREHMDSPELFDTFTVGWSPNFNGNPVGMSAQETAYAVLDFLSRDDLVGYSDLVRAVISRGGDTDSVCALVLGLASCAPNLYPNDLPANLVGELDNGNIDELLEMDKILCT